MESLFSTLFLDIAKRINEEVEGINWIEQDFGQDTFDKWRPNVDFPAVLIDFPSTNFDDIAQYNQLGNTTISIRLLVAPFSQSYDDAPLEVKVEALKYFELENEVYKALHGWQPEEGYAQPLTRKSATSSNRNDIGLRIRTLTFTTMFEEYIEE